MDVPSLPAGPALGQPIPTTVKHPISVHLPAWEDVCDWANKVPRVIQSLQGGYPRSSPYQDVQRFFDICRSRFALNSESIMIFPDARHAQACKSFVTSTAIHGENAAAGHTISSFGLQVGSASRCLDGNNKEQLHTTLYVVTLREKAVQLGSLFWRLTGTGISPRLAERCLQVASFQKLHCIDSDIPSTIEIAPPPVYETLCGRLAGLLQRGCIQKRPQQFLVKPSDTFLFPSGMAAIYHLHRALLEWRNRETIIFGFLFEVTIKMMKTYGPSFRFYGRGTDEEIDQLEAYLEERGNANPIQAVWCECPSNPLLWTVNLGRLRRLADQYDFPLVVDETIGSFANVDVLDAADIVVTSLTKSFNGFADLLAGSVVLNPRSRYYTFLKSAVAESYTNNLYIDDAMQLERNSRDFLSRAARLNANAEHLADFLAPLAADPDSVVDTVYYPKLSPSAPRYREYMRTPTESFTPGYGCLLTIAFRTVAAGAAFYDHLEVHKGLSLGAQITLAIPYIQLLPQHEKEWAAQYGVRETIVRISVGLEDPEEILDCVKRALAKAELTLK